MPPDNLGDSSLPLLKRAFVGSLEALIRKPALDPRRIDFSRVKRVLVVRQHDMMGDFLLATPVLRALRGKFPAARLGVLVRDEFAPVLLNNPLVDEILVLQKTLNQWDPAKLFTLFSALFRKWDLAVVLNTVSHSLSSDILAGLSGSRVIVGSAARRFQGCSRNFLYNIEAPEHPGARHQTDRNLDIVRAIGADTDDRSELMCLQESETRAAALEYPALGYDPARPVVAMHVGAGKLKNRWPAERFAQLARRLREGSGARIVLCWGPRESDLAAEFLRGIDFEVVRVPPGGLRRLAAALTLSDLLICNDTGIMHLAASVGVPLVAVFGPTDPAEWKPSGDSFVAVRGEDGAVGNVTVEQVHDLARGMIRAPRHVRSSPHATV